MNDAVEFCYGCGKDKRYTFRDGLCSQCQRAAEKAMKAKRVARLRQAMDTTDQRQWVSLSGENRHMRKAVLGE